MVEPSRPISLPPSVVERRVGVVDRDLGDFDRVGPVVAQGQLDLARPQHRALDRDLLDRRPGALAEPGTAEQGEGADRDRDQGQRDRAQRPGRQAAAGAALGAGPGLHQDGLPAAPGQLAVGRRGGGRALSREGSPTRKNPVQPSSANSLTWAWNM